MGVRVSGDYEYSLLDNGTAIITRYSGDRDLVTVPAQLDAIPVSAIGPSSFKSRRNMMSVVIPEGVTEIGDYAVLIVDDLPDVPATRRHHWELGLV
jgi:hypothetical protein